MVQALCKSFLNTSGKIKSLVQTNISINASLTIELGVTPDSCLNNPILLPSTIRFLARDSQSLVASKPYIPASF